MPKVPQEFLEILEREGASLESEGVSDVGLPPEGAMRAITILRRAGIGIIGGEVWERKGDRITPTYDIWYVNRADYQEMNEFLQSSWAMAEREVSRYLHANERIIITLGI